MRIVTLLVSPIIRSINDRLAQYALDLGQSRVNNSTYVLLWGKGFHVTVVGVSTCEVACQLVMV